jgi:hypothetical protein
MPPICTIEGCEAHAKVRGLCPKHYKRTRRHGDPNVVKPRGAPRNATKAEVRMTLGRDWSPRTFERYWRASGILGWLAANAGEDARKRVFEAATRPNGTLNVTKLLALAVEAARPVLLSKLEANPNLLDEED